MPAITENYLDVFVFPGTTFFFDFQLAPLDITGGSAILVVDGLPPGGAGTSQSFTVTCTPEQTGAVAIADFSLTIIAATTLTWPAGCYDYRLVATLADTTSQVILTGQIVVKQYAVVS